MCVLTIVDNNIIIINIINNVIIHNGKYMSPQTPKPPPLLIYI